MSGEEHYQEAERLLRGRECPSGGWISPGADQLAAAQVHATLALAYATGRHVLGTGGIKMRRDAHSDPA